MFWLIIIGFLVWIIFNQSKEIDQLRSEQKENKEKKDE